MAQSLLQVNDSELVIPHGPLPGEVPLKRLAVGVGLLLLLVWPVATWGAEGEKAPEPPPSLDGGDTAWMLVSTGLVMLMVPGLALFYGGMVRRKNILGTMMQSMVALGLIGIQWLLLGYSLAFGKSYSGLIGWDWRYLGLNDVLPMELFPGTRIPIFVHCIYQGMFAIITPALISGAVAERIKFGPYCLFILLWAVLVYDPLAHWVWAVNAQGDPAGWLGAQNALDFAGGTVVHISAGFSALAAILILKRRRGYPEHAMHPNSMVLTLTGAGLLWFGWFGFNGGSALGSGALAGMALTATQVAAAAASISWLVAEWLHRGKPTGLGFASGLVAGLVAVTPASGYISPLSAVCIGLIAGAVCYGSVCLKPRLKYDDSLDAFGIHGVGGFLGAILTGLFASTLLYGNAAGKENGFILGNLGSGVAAQVGVQALAAVCAAVYAFVVTLILVTILNKLWGFGLDEKSENAGLDRSEHGETGFDLSLALEMAPATSTLPEPRPAAIPPNGKRHFTIVVEGAVPRDLLHVWSKCCGAGNGTKPGPEFESLYPNMTTVQGNRFNFRGGDPILMRQALQRLFQNHLEGTAIQTHVES